MSDSKSDSYAARELSRVSSLSRRSLLHGTIGLGAAVALGLGHARPAHAATTMTWMGWQGYETPIKAGTFLKDNDIDFQPTFISSNEEIITKLQAGGIG
jgi:spermidine/putrescine-binding protein